MFPRSSFFESYNDNPERARKRLTVSRVAGAVDDQERNYFRCPSTHWATV
jgi:hypothetical protein